jgi:hypothetical protein
MKTAHWNFAIVFALVAVMSTSYMLDGPDESTQDWSESDAIKELRAAKQGSDRQHVAGQAVCRESRGPNSEARWTEEGHLVCTTRRGIKVAKVD